MSYLAHEEQGGRGLYIYLAAASISSNSGGGGGPFGHLLYLQRNVFVTAYESVNRTLR